MIEKSIFHKMIDLKQQLEQKEKEKSKRNERIKGNKNDIENDEIYIKFLKFLNHDIDKFDLKKLMILLKRKKLINQT